MSEAVRKVIIKKVKKKHGEGHHGGSWKVAYADFVTAMMAFFLLLWLLSMVSEDKRIAMAEYFKNFSIFKESGKTFQPGSAFVIADHIKKAELKPDQVAMRLKKAMANKKGGESLSEQVLVDAVEGGVRIQIVDKEGSPMFLLGSAEPTERMKEILASVGEVLKDQDAKIAVEGHTDSAPFRGDQITNWELSTQRASAARRALESSGLDPAHVSKVVGYADTELLVKNNPKDAQNRRISIIVMQPKDAAALTGDVKRLDGITPNTSAQASPAAQTSPAAKTAAAVQQPAGSGSAATADSRESTAKIGLEKKKSEMKKKKRDVMGLWD